MTISYPFLASRIFNTPLLIHPGKLDAIIAGLGGRLLGQPVADFPHAALPEGWGQQMASEMFSTRNGEVVKVGPWARYQAIDGVAVIGVSGATVHRTRMDANSTTLLGYNDITSAVEHAMGNPDVHALLRVYDTPGGEVQGAFEHAQRLAELAGKKPMYAIADGMAASAGYLGGSVADQLAVSPTGYVGSIGVVMRHVDFSAALAADGIKVTHIFAGDHKVDGNQFEPLPSSVRADWQAEINGLYAMFVDAAASARRMQADAIRATQAQTYRGQAAVDIGLADRVATTDQLIAELSAMRTKVFPVGQAAAHSITSQEQSMTTPANSTGQTAPVITQADLDAAQKAGFSAGVAEERTRVSGILAHPAAASHPAITQQCINTGLTVDQAAGFLGAVPAAPAAAKQDQFATMMASLGNPAVSGVESKAGGDQGQPTAESVAASILDSFKQQ